MDKLKDAYRKRNRKQFFEEFEKRLKKKGEATQQPVDELKETWERENAEMRMRGIDAPKTTSIPQSLREKWKKEDDETVMRK